MHCFQTGFIGKVACIVLVWLCVLFLLRKTSFKDEQQWKCECCSQWVHHIACATRYCICTLTESLCMLKIDCLSLAIGCILCSLRPWHIKIGHCLCKVCYMIYWCLINPNTTLTIVVCNFLNMDSLYAEMIHLILAMFMSGGYFGNISGSRMAAVLHCFFLRYADCWSHIYLWLVDLNLIDFSLILSKLKKALTVVLKTSFWCSLQASTLNWKNEFHMMHFDVMLQICHRAAWLVKSKLGFKVKKDDNPQWKKSIWYSLIYSIWCNITSCKTNISFAVIAI